MKTMFWRKLKDRQAKRPVDGAADAAGGESAAGEISSAPVPSDGAATERELALSPQMQAFWTSVFEQVELPRTHSGERPGLFTVTPGSQEGEALVHIDVPREDYVEGQPPRMERIVTLSIQLDHDHRLFGDQYYCVDCDTPDSDTVH